MTQPTLDKIKCWPITIAWVLTIFALGLAFQLGWLHV
jgi:hypothetical protein